MDDSDAKPKKLIIGTLEGPHRENFMRAIGNVLSSPIAEITYAQIIDGLILSDVAFDVYEGNVSPLHPLVDEHKDLCPGVLEKARDLRTSFDASALEVDSTLIYAYQAASPGSRAFQTRLIELVAVAVHQIAVWIFKQDWNRHKDDELGLWRPSGDEERFYPQGFPPTFFLHRFYRHYDQYPEGVADIVGYWAENRIFGGVVLFDRRESGSAPDVEPDAVYLHPDRRDTIYRIFRLLDSQKQLLVEFLLSDQTPPANCPLPLLADANNRQRVDPEESPESSGIYRDQWERRPPLDSEGDERLRTVVDTFNYVSREEWGAAKRRADRWRHRPRGL